MNNDHQRGHRERLRKKYASSGVNSLHDYEIVELLLTYAIPQKDVKPLAKDLMNRFNNFAGIIDAPLNELVKVKGIAENSAILFKLIKDISSEYLADKMKVQDPLTSPEAVINFARMKLVGREDEAFMIIYLNVKNYVSKFEIINEGTIDETVVYPRNIIKKTLANNATGIIVVHNHPSGICTPSESDKKLTKSLKSALDAVNIRLVDHLIVGKAGYFSFVQQKLL
jgi:DNA repair protein RadC